MEQDNPSILIVDDDTLICEFISEGLSGAGYKCDIALTAEDVISKIGYYQYELVLLDIKLPDGSGIELLTRLKTFRPDLKIVMITGIGEVDTAIQAMKMGASDYIIKPFTIDKVISSISKALQERKRPALNGQYNVSGETPTGIMNAIAHGVEAQVNYFDFHLRRVVEKTVDIARKLGVSDREIEAWASEQHEIFHEKDNYFGIALGKLEKNLGSQAKSRTDSA